MILGGKVINPGELRTQITLESLGVSAETGGFQVPTWSALATVWSRWKNAHGTEALASGTVDAEAPAAVLIRYLAGLDTTCAVSKGGVRYEIVSLDDIEERHEFIELKVRRMKAG
jgi:SPP1 family predicted phage head-tail adaptor